MTPWTINAQEKNNQKKRSHCKKAMDILHKQQAGTKDYLLQPKLCAFLPVSEDGHSNRQGGVFQGNSKDSRRWEQLRERRKRSRESGPHRFYFLYFPHPFCKKTYFLYFPHPFCKKAQLIKSRVIVNSRVVIYGANELPICKKPKFWPPNVKGLRNRSPLVKREAFN